MLTKGAIGNLINRYKAVLGKCRIMNTFGSLAVAAMFVAAPLAASAAELASSDSMAPIAGGTYEVTAGDVTITGSSSTVFQYGTITLGDGLTLTLNGNDPTRGIAGTVADSGTNVGIITGAGGNLVINAISDLGAAGMAQGDYDIDVNSFTINSPEFGIYNDGPGNKTISANTFTINSGGDAIHLQGAQDSDVTVTANTVDITGGVGIRNASTNEGSALSITADTINITATSSPDHVAAVDSVALVPSHFRPAK